MASVKVQAAQRVLLRKLKVVVNNQATVEPVR
jgi:hypothetical protein